ncbi:MAG: IS1182 family transposase [Burkholderiaceae bacterium]|jgi:transposase|nr:IS1182 family transposase [Gemmatimonadales bacterium]MCO5121929.1 IS1182 family transposase [Burkholderiaceae bacterium]
MPTTYRPYDPDQLLLLPASLKEWLPEDHLAWFVSDAVDALDLKAFHARYEGDGRRRQPYDPSMMVKVLVYAYASGVFSSRRIARSLEQDVAFRVLGADNFPAHRTIREFRQLHLSEFSALFVQVVQLAREAGLVKLGRIGIDGTKVKANASKRKAMSYGRMGEREAQLKAEIEALSRQAEQQDAAEDREHGPDRRGDELPQELARRERRLEAIQAAKARLEERQREQDRQDGRQQDDEGNTRGPGGRLCQRAFGQPEAGAQDNFTDPQSRIMKTGNGFEQCYNAQAAVDESGLIVATEVIDAGNDGHHLVAMVAATKKNTGALPQMSLADSGYASEVNFAALEALGAVACVALGREAGKKPRKIDPDRHPATQRMADRMATDEGQAHYRRRKVIPEPVFGWIKQAMGFRQFSVRGLVRVNGEWNLVCLASNLRRMHRLGWVAA